MITYRRCPRCNWRLNIAKDQHGWFVECINCGFTRDLMLAQAKNKTATDMSRPATKASSLK